MKQYFKPGMILASALAVGLIPVGVQADEHDKKTVITVDEPIQVADTYLEPGTYVFKLIESSSDRHTVEIYNKDQSHLIKLMFAVPNYRLRPTSTNHSQFTFWETPPGTAKAVRAWFYPGDNYGHEFPYPDNLKQLSSTAAVPTTTTVAAVAPPQPAPAVTESEKSEAVTPAPEPVQQAAAPEQPRREEEPVQIAQNTPAPQPQAQAPAPQSVTDTKEPEELPKTASPYPLIGLAGLLCAGMFALLRMKRLA